MTSAMYYAILFCMREDQIEQIEKLCPGGFILIYYDEPNQKLRLASLRATKNLLLYYFLSHAYLLIKTVEQLLKGKNNGEKMDS